MRLAVHYVMAIAAACSAATAYAHPSAFNVWIAVFCLVLALTKDDV